MENETQTLEAPAEEAIAGNASDTIGGGPSFYELFKKNMDGLGLPAPDSLFGTLTAAVATIKSIQSAAEAYGPEVTIAELLGAGALADGLAVAGALTASFYVGASIGSVIVAGVEWIW